MHVFDTNFATDMLPPYRLRSVRDRRQRILRARPYRSDAQDSLIRVEMPSLTAATSGYGCSQQPWSAVVPVFF